ncbi:aldehyde dehydrogenase family protein [Ruegeria sp. 2012CJ41-6]|uniref:Aldehyde dehydrogenase family protein n=1 Tax=Ruegeria spongiae TaxID=2942209 RepID=A0ABT0Q5L2_9RHOB|nr:aldehyde dehydrogenase family protein [Ruegeria spongiae]MCL6284194.1 aldehyde dehydrogenase family protein [Ruegeria spongiae]
MTNLNLIGGEWVAAQAEIDNRSPANPDDLVGMFARGDAGAVDDAVQAATQSFPGWAAASPQYRADILDRAGSTILNRSAEIGRILAREEGKTLAEATGEAVRAGQLFKFYAGEAVRLTGDAIASIRDGVDVEVTREPLGVIGLITPWNFPIAIPAWKAAPAVAFGNTVVMKPAEQTPASAHILAEILHESGCPPGVFNLVMGPGSVIGNALVEHPQVAAISFTGSEGVGQRIAEGCARQGKKLQMEMGGKNPMVVMADADLDVAIGACINGAFFSTGQRCTASSRLIVEEGVHDAFVDRMQSAMRKLVLGDPLDAATQIGPVASESQLRGNLGYVDLARTEGAEVIGGAQLDRPGYFQAPAMFVNATNDMRTSREEIFGPCASIIKASDFDHAVALANDTKFGLSSGICTSSLRYARDFKRRSEAGMVMVNLPTAGVDYHVPFGGRKSSSVGSREQGRYAVDFYTSVKTAYTFAG